MFIIFSLFVLYCYYLWPGRRWELLFDLILSSAINKPPERENIYLLIAIKRRMQMNKTLEFAFGVRRSHEQCKTKRNEVPEENRCQTEQVEVISTASSARRCIDAERMPFCFRFNLPVNRNSVDAFSPFRIPNVGAPHRRRNEVIEIDTLSCICSSNTLAASGAGRRSPVGRDGTERDREEQSK